MKNNYSHFLFTCLILLFLVKCSKDDESSIVSVSLSENDITLALKVHNDARADVGVPSLTWSNSLSEDALKWAITMAESDEMYHSSNDSRPGQGENLYYWCCSTGEVETFSLTPAKNASQLWYNEISDYTYAEIGSPLNANVMIGHYTQMIWSTTTEVGMAKARSASGKEFVVARYSPPGNWSGEFPY
ncbi:MAG: CAP family protein [Flavobacteriaceae bacterium]|nr:CAP family protein [Flavobacteriaceae bacterium]